LTSTQNEDIIKKQTLTDAELVDVAQLTSVCNSYENLHMSFSWLSTRHLDNYTNDFLYYEDSVLVGYLNISSYGTKEKELLGMVHPDHRRKGIFSALLAAAKKECLRRGVQRIILVCEHASESGQAFVTAIGGHHVFSEHTMILGTFHPRHAFHQQLKVRKAEAGDVEALIAIRATDASSLEEAQSYITNFLPQLDQVFYLGLLDGKPISCLRLDETEDEVGIYGFVVLPEYRGRGYGRQLLESVIRTIQSQSDKRIMLDVDTDNTNAIGLYRSCGFEVKTTYDYYELIE
jgi:ribosomal protein S18 acetylase RimI-like enzyme